MPASSSATNGLIKISVLLTSEEAARFEAYCGERGYKKSTLIARLIREHLDREGFTAQIEMFGGRMTEATKRT